MPQFPLMRATVRAFGLTPIEQDKYEADDLIATYARQARERGAEVLIVSADKDLMQLIEPGVSMYDPASGTGDTRREERRIGEPEVLEYFGVPPAKVIDVQALAGDSTDNVPGAPGIGVKTAAQLINEYGDLETLLARAGEIKQPKRRETLTNPETVKLIRISKQLVTLARDVEVEAPLESLGLPKLGGRTADRLSEGDGVHHHHAARRRDLRRRSRGRRAGPRLRRAGRLARPQRRSRGRPRPPPVAEAPPAPVRTDARTDAENARRTRGRPRRADIGFEVDKYPAVRTLADLDAWIARAYEAGVVAFDTETTSLDPIRADLVGVSLAVAPGEACYIPINHRRRRGSVRRRPAARPARRSRRARAAEAAARGARMCSRSGRTSSLIGTSSNSAASRSRRSTTRC